MLHAAVLRSPYARARVTSIDLEPARKAPGVRAVVGPPDLDALTDEPGYVGHAVAAVAAETFGQAQAALEQIEVQWEVLEPLLDPDEAVRQESFVSDVAHYERGDFERGIAEADVVVEAEYRTQVVVHNSMETHQAVCHWEDGGITIYISTQYIWGIRSAMADHLGLAPDKVRVVCHAMGGGFGSKNGPGDYTPIAAELAKRTGRPVKCALTRREENVAAGNRNATIQRLTAAAKSDGTLVALGGDFVNAVGFSGWSATTEGPMKMLYACDNVRTTQYPAKLNLPPMAAFRAPGFVEGTFALECLLDEVAAKLDIDPLELRRRNYADSDRTDDRPFSSKNLAECYRRAEPHWAKRDEVRARSQGPVEARHRSCLTDLVRRRRPTLVCMDSRRLSRSCAGRHGHAGHRHGHAHRDGADRSRGARDSVRARAGLARRLRTRPVRLDLRGLVDRSVDGAGGSVRRRGCQAADPRDRRAAVPSRGAGARSP